MVVSKNFKTFVSLIKYTLNCFTLIYLIHNLIVLSLKPLTLKDSIKKMRTSTCPLSYCDIEQTIVSKDSING